MGKTHIPKSLLSACVLGEADVDNPRFIPPTLPLRVRALKNGTALLLEGDTPRGVWASKALAVKRREVLDASRQP